MRTIIIFKTSAPDERIVLRTDSMYDDYESMFTVMTVQGAIDGVINPYKGGSVVYMSDISRFIANNTGIEAVALSPDEAKEDVVKTTPKFLSIDVYSIVNETTYREWVDPAYQKQYPYEVSKDSLPWIAIKSLKAVLDTPFDLSITKDGVDVEFGGTSDKVGTVSGDKKKITIEDFQNVMFGCVEDLGQNDPKGTYLLKFEMAGMTDLRELVIP